VAKPLNNTGVRRIWRALLFSLKGLRAAFRHEAAFRQEVALALVMVPAGLWLGQSALERLLLAGSVFFLMIVELLNSAVEAVVDRIGPEQHELAGMAKDMGSAAVLLTILLIAVTWLAVLLF